MNSLRLFSFLALVAAGLLLTTGMALAKNESNYRSVEPRTTYAQNHALPSARIVSHHSRATTLVTTLVITQPVPTAPARVLLEVPADAEVRVGGSRTLQSGTVREFVSPPLHPGRKYAYEVEVRWTENGRSVVRTHAVHVSAGTTATVNFAPGPSGQALVTTPPAR